jgi:hypothetical protein
MNCYCTIITADYSPYAASLQFSLQNVDSSTKKLFALVASLKEDCKTELVPFDGVEYIFLDNLCKDGLGKAIKDKYYGDFMDEFWLLQHKKYDKVIYLDCDLYFYSNPDFLFEELDKNRVLLTPHWRSRNPIIDQENFLLLGTDGLFNGGFIAANSEALDVVTWWAETCLFICLKDKLKGLWDDQTHLNMMPVYFEGVKIIRHKGCNVAYWNSYECERAKQENGEVIIAKEFPIVFIHFTKSTITGILNGQEVLLKPYLEKYSSTLMRFREELNIIKIHQEKLNKFNAEQDRITKLKEEEEKKRRKNLPLIQRIRLQLAEIKRKFK